MLRKLILQARRHQLCEVTWDICWYASANEQSDSCKIFILAACYQSSSCLLSPTTLFALPSCHSSLVWKASGSQVDFLTGDEMPPSVLGYHLFYGSCWHYNFQMK